MQCLGGLEFRRVAGLGSGRSQAETCPEVFLVALYRPWMSPMLRCQNDEKDQQVGLQMWLAVVVDTLLEVMRSMSNGRTLHESENKPKSSVF